MVDSYSFEALDQPAWDVIGGGISAFNAQQAGDDDGRNLCFVIRSARGEICGGVIGATYWDWLYINLMWIREDLRGQGYGARLLALAEEEGLRRGARQSHLDTFSVQALEFYRKFGYQVFGQLENFPAGHTRYFLSKDLP